MQTKDIIFELRTKNGMSQDELAEKMYVTRQAVSRWENGETIPNIDTLKLLSEFFNISINALLGSEEQLICQCCGKPIEATSIGKEADVTSDVKYCEWCYVDGDFTLDFWRTYKGLGGKEMFDEFKKKLVDEINALTEVDGLPKLEELNILPGEFVNLEYRLPNGSYAKFLDDNATYLGSQLECEYGGERCFGVVANMEFILICTYEKDGENPELVLYKKR